MVKYNGKIEPKRRIYDSLRNFIGENKVYKAGDTLCISTKDNGEYDTIIEADGKSTFRALMEKGGGGGGQGIDPSSLDLADVALSGSFNDLKDKPSIPSALASLTDDTTHRVVSDSEKTTWNGKQDAITNVTASVDSNVGTPSVTPTWNNGTLDLAFHNIKGQKGDDGAVGATGPQGDSVLVGQGDLPLAHVLGNDNTKAISQKGITDVMESGGEMIIPSSSLESHVCSIGNGSWYRNSTGPQAHCVYPVVEGQKIELQAVSTAGSFYAFLTSSYNPATTYSNGNSMPLVSGTSRMSAPNTTFREIEIPTGCAYLALNLVDGAGTSVSWNIRIPTYLRKLGKRVDAVEKATSIESEFSTSNNSVVDWFIQNTTPLKWGMGSGKWQCKLIDIEKYRGGKLTITKNPNGVSYYAFLKSTTRSNNSIPDWCDNCTRVTIDSNNSPLTVDIPNDASYLYLYVNANGTNVTPSLILTQSILSTFEETVFAPTSEIDISKLEVQDCSIGSSSWYMASSGSAKDMQSHVAFPVTEGETIRLRGAENAGWYYGLLTSSYAPPYVDGDAIPFVSGETRRTASFKEQIITIPEGCAYIALTMVDGAGNKADYKVERGIEKTISKDATKSVPVKLRIAHWNLGHFALGGNYDTIITHENYATMYQKWAEKINEISSSNWFRN